MASIKQSIKKVLTDRQHEKYAKEVKSKNLSYDEWIRIQEQKLEIDVSITSENEKSLTNDFLKQISGRENLGNEGNYSDFANFCREMEIWNKRSGPQEKKTVLEISVSLLMKNFDAVLSNCNADVILITLYEGTISEIAYPLIWKYFNQNENLILIYGDEDIGTEKGRTTPWFKPDWSPDRFLSCFYLGGLVAVRKEALEKAWKSLQVSGEQAFTGWDCTDRRGKEALYFLLHEMLRLYGGYSKRSGQAAMPAAHIKQVLFHSRECGYDQICELKLPDSVQHMPVEQDGRKTGNWNGDRSGNDKMTSVIIPSKDNPKALFCCIHSLIERTLFPGPVEIIVVDNGSCEENKGLIEEELQKLKKQGWAIRYLYRPMDFNFSSMCNLGADQVEGELLLFLNDDMEIIQPDWLQLMAEKALLTYVGAVGVKLLYPDTSIIQHAGITNLRVGPAHKLQFLSDEQNHYYGMNRGVHNMLAATGACLMMRREVFWQAGGFNTELAVAFNDVDLCYTIYEQGYYNVVRNDVTLYHHESLSRGKDGESEEKQQRLLREKDILYRRHQGLYGKDPFYHPYLTSDMLEAEYSPASRYQVTLEMPWSKVERCEKRIQRARQDQCLVVGMECAMDIYKWKYGVTALEREEQAGTGETGYYFQGYTFVIGSDNACYKMTLLLKNKDNENIFSITVDRRYRQDIKKNLKDQLNVDLTGFAAKVQADMLPAGSYQFGMLAEDQCSRLRLVNWSNWTLEVSG